MQVLTNRRAGGFDEPQIRAVVGRKWGGYTDHRRVGCIEDARIGAGLEHVVRAERCDLIVADVRHGAEATRDCLNLVRIDVQPDTHEACPRELDGHRQAGVTESNHGDAC